MDSKLVASAAVGAGVAAFVTFLLLKQANKGKDAALALPPGEHIVTKHELDCMEARLRTLATEKASSPRGNPSRAASAGPQTFPPVTELLRAHQKKILVTGGAGFVGSHLVDALMMQVCAGLRGSLQET